MTKKSPNKNVNRDHYNKKMGTRDMMDGNYGFISLLISCGSGDSFN